MVVAWAGRGRSGDIGRLVRGPATRLYKASTRTNLDKTSITQRHSNLPDLKLRRSLLHPKYLPEMLPIIYLNISFFQQTF